MASGNDVILNFCEDDSINVGHSNSDGASTLYEVHTALTINPTGDVFDNPLIQCSIVAGKVWLCLGKQLLIFNETCQDHVATINIDNYIDCIAVSEDGSFLIIGDCSGTLTFTYVPAVQMLFSKKITEVSALEESENSARAFSNIQIVPSEHKGLLCIYIWTVDGKLLKYENFNLAQLCIALEEQDLDMAEQIQKVMKFSSCVAEPAIVKHCYIVPNLHPPELVISGLGNKAVNILRCDTLQRTLICQAFGSNGVLKCQVTANGIYIIVLDTKFQLHILSYKKLILMKTFKKFLVKDFLLLDTPDNISSSTCDSKIVLLTVSEGKSSLQIFNFPQYQHVYTLELSPFSFLAVASTNQENLIIIEGECLNYNSTKESSAISQLTVRCIYEALPETRLSRLLRKRKFQEAEEFAKLYELDLQEVYRSKANYILDLLSPWKLENLSETEIDKLQEDLKQCINKLADLNDVMQCCFQAQLPTIDSTRSIIQLVKDRLKEKKEQRKLLQKICLLLNKLDTFEMAFGASEFQSLWHEFSQCNIINEIMKYLKSGNLKLAFLLWHKHQEEFSISSVELMELLHSIPETINSSEYFHWLRDEFLGYVVNSLPETLIDIAAWIIMRIKNMELSEKTCWPDNALKLSKVMFEVCDNIINQLGSTGFQFQTQFFLQTFQYSIQNKDSPLYCLHQLINNLRDLKELRTKYNCCISLADYCQENKESVAFSLLEWAYTAEEIFPVLNGFIRPFLKRHNLNEDKTLFRYIKEVMLNDIQDKWYWEEAFLEDKAIVILKCLTDTEYLCKGTLQLISAAPLPWSNEVNALVKDVLKCDHASVHGIRKQIQLLEVKKILQNYGLYWYNISDEKNSEILVYHILLKDRPTALEDALEIAKAYRKPDIVEVYLFRLRFLIKQNQFSEFSNILKNIPKPTVTACCKRIVLYTECLLNCNYNVDVHQKCEEELCFTKASLLCLKYLSTLLPEYLYEEHQEMLLKFEDLHILQAEFGIFISFEDIEQFKKRQEIFESNLEKYTSLGCLGVTEFIPHDKDRKLGNFKTSLSRLCRLGKALRFTEEETLASLTRKLISQSKIEQSLEICKKISYGSSETVLLNVSHLLIEQLAEEKLEDPLPIVNSIYNLISCASIKCTPDLLEKCTIYLNWISLLHYLLNELENSNIFIKTQKEKNSELQFDSVYREIGLRIDPGYIASLFCKLVLNFLKNIKSPLTGKELLEPSEQVLDHLKEKGQDLAAIQVILTTVASVLEGSISQKVQVEKDVIHDWIDNATNQRKELNYNTLIKIFKQRHADLKLALALSLSLKQEYSFEILNNILVRFGYDYRSIQSLSETGTKLAMLHRNPTHLKTFVILNNLAIWGRRLSKFKICFKDVFNLKGEREHNALFQEIVLHPDVDPSLIEEYCQTFDLDVDNSLLSYLETLLTSDSLLPPSPSVDKSGEKKYLLSPSIWCVNNPDFAKCQKALTVAFSKANQIFKKVTNKNNLLDKLKVILEQVDSYNHEVLEFILETIKKFPESAQISDISKGIELINFIKAYQRISSPAECELSNTEFTLNSGLPEIAKVRLPYHILLADPWKIISPELAATTVSLWLELAPVLQLPKAQLLMQTVKNIINQIIKQGNMDNNKGVWKPEPHHLPLLDEIPKLISQVGDPGLAAACANWVASHLPLGHHKVSAAQNALNLAKSWKEKTEDKKAQDAVEKLSKLVRRLSTEEVLLRYELSSPEMRTLLPSPSKLIFKLYEHPSVEERINLTTGKYPDIHGAAEEIASIHGLSISKVHLALLDNWLPCESSGSYVDESMLDMSVCFMQDQREINEKNLKRVTYILQFGSMKEKALYLMKIALLESPNVNFAHRYRALRCLFAIAGYDQIEKLSGSKIGGLKNLMKSLWYLSELESLRISIKLESFEKCSKEELAESLLKGYSHDSKAVVLVACLCLGYDVTNTELWDVILKHLVDFEKIKELEYIIERLSRNPFMWHNAMFLQAWNLVIFAPFQNIVLPLNQQKVDELIRISLLIHRWPITTDIDVQKLSDCFLKAQLEALGFVCLLHLSDPVQRTSKIQEFLTKVPYEKVISSMDFVKQSKNYFPDLNRMMQVLSQHSPNSAILDK